MGEEYGREEWQEDEAAATFEAIRRIETAIASGETVLDFTDLTAMTRLPDELEAARGVRGIYAGYNRPDGRFAGFVDHRRLSDLSPLVGLSALTVLDLSGTSVTDLSALAGLTVLTSLDLSGTSVTDLSALAGLSALTSLNLNRTEVTDLSALAGMTALTELDLTGTGVTDLAALAGMTALTSLGLSGTEVSDLSALAGLSPLISLDLRDTEITNLSALASLTALTELDLNGTGVTDLSALAGLFSLTSLNLGDTKVTDMSVLLTLPQFAAEKAQYLNFQRTPAASRKADPNMEALSGLPGDRCAIETVQYLKGTHPLYRDPHGKGNEGAPGAGLAQRLAEGSSVKIVVEAGLLEARNAGAPERLGPRELSLRLTALREHMGEILHEAPARQVPADLLRRFQRYATALQREEVTYILLDGPIAALRGGVNDRYVTEALDGGFVEMWRAAIKMHDELRPFLLPPEEEDQPDLPPEATPEAGIDLAERAEAALIEAQANGVVGASVVEAMQAATDYFKVAKENAEKKPAWAWRAYNVLFGVFTSILGVPAGIGVLADALLKVQELLATPAGQALVTHLRPLWEILKKHFGL